ncbi:hypothetical protein BFP97_03820 [Roseivirga sp. 4D4]|uniref:hypothetical protein n=1 Tax=Roseivirga sp. 4D4 TaxID=1889784 RepID=UPI000853DA9B|nr:hypothetical protein [Roseivirga sp. 4D4]OEK00687.1 hypothetical protein BFP97_03820 [Roseivirga sp. 4D4]
MPRYFKRNWQETRGDEFDSWGTSVWFFEVDDHNFPTRQIEVYQNGKRLRYDSKNPFDDYGQLSDQALDLEEFKELEIRQDQFQLEWEKPEPRS